MQTALVLQFLFNLLTIAAMVVHRRSDHHTHRHYKYGKEYQ